MKTFWRAAGLAITLLVAQLIVAPAYAASITVFLDQSNENELFPAGDNYLSVTISDGVDGAIDFSVEIIGNLRDMVDSNYGIQSFSLNFGDSGATQDNLLLPDGWTAKGGSGKEYSASHSVFGKFDVQIHGKGNSRQDPLMFSIVGVDGDTPEDYIQQLSSGGQSDALFAAHVAGFAYADADVNREFSSSQVTSAHFGGSTVVPLPASAWLMLSGLGMLGVIGSRRRRSR